jgi:MFS family permease
MRNASGGSVRFTDALRRWTSQFSRGYWTFFVAALLFEFGFGLFFFLFNLYLTDLHFNERVLGRIWASMTLGNVAGTIPAMLLVRRFGLRRLLLFSFLVVPFTFLARIAFLEAEAQYTLAFLTGVALCCWPICYSPMVARLTQEKNRTSAFSLIFAGGIAMAALAGVAGGHLPGVIIAVTREGTLVAGIRVVLLLSCATALLAAWPLLKLERDRSPAQPSLGARWFHPFLIRFLPAFLVWNVVTGSFPGFAAVYLQQFLHLPLGRVGEVFGASQLLQITAVLLTPLLFRRLGRTGGIASAQIATAAALLLLAGTHAIFPAVGWFLAYNGAQWMCGPGIYSLLMDRIPEDQRGTASAIQNLCGAMCQSGTAAVTGTCIVRFGYPALIAGNAGFALISALLFLVLGATTRQQEAGAIRASRVEGIPA